MPTGYTADIAKGITFEQYAWNCARAFGALMMLRDDHQAPIPAKIEPDGYYQRCLEEAHETLTRVSSWSTAQIAAEYQAHFDARLAAYQARIDRTAALRAKYDAMLAQVQAWQPPTPDHEAYKQFMASQIVESIKFDCCVEHDCAPLPEDPAAWLAEWTADLTERLVHYEQRHREEVQRAHNRTKWITAIRESFERAPS
ncbi:hypothetical protein [Burkholderia lata]|uniref:hypothetical protein n=1 Tax=Burkholderia lata (strain ATCC 17760 / DSM 23089 / LMG 22485 / NCIMB 9086 / R18194 / 383) TaxID=482957 RepID=UPI0014532976|nr:hypothetical protein [Burkholderia lata]VWB97432.1 hypothetical protein BLA15816_04707 [Burkholderia lata]